MSWFSNIFDITTRGELRTRIFDLERKKKELEEEVDELNCELAKAEDLVESLKKVVIFLLERDSEKEINEE